MSHHVTYFWFAWPRSWNSSKGFASALNPGRNHPPNDLAKSIKTFYIPKNEGFIHVLSHSHALMDH